MRSLPQKHPNTKIRREHDPRSARRRSLLLIGCLVLAAGFVFAVRQQIVAVELGYRTEALKRERERLIEERRRLMLELQAHSSPAHLERVAREIGMQPTSAVQIVTARHTVETVETDASGEQQATRSLVGASVPAVGSVRR